MIGASEESPLESAAEITVGVAGAGESAVELRVADVDVGLVGQRSERSSACRCCRCRVQPLASVTLTVIEKTPVWVGVPERTPLDESETPDGSEPLLIEKTAGVCVPTPLCVKVKLPLSGALYVPLFELGFVTVMVWQAMVSV